MVTGAPGAARSGMRVINGAGSAVGVGVAAEGVGACGAWHAANSAVTIATATSPNNTGLLPRNNVFMIFFSECAMSLPHVQTIRRNCATSALSVWGHAPVVRPTFGQRSDGRVADEVPGCANLHISQRSYPENTQMRQNKNHA
jgi:hypothetical protein